MERLIVNWKDADTYNRLMKQDGIDMEKEGVAPNDTFEIASVKFDDGIEAGLNICTEETAIWAEIWWRDADGEVLEQSEPFYEIDGEFSLDASHSVLIETDLEEQYWQNCRDAILAWVSKH